MIELLTARTPNGIKISIALEEMGLPYEVRRIDLRNGEQKEPWFLELNPNGRIPVIIDHDSDDLTIFESGAILIYLAEKSGQLLPTEPAARAQTLQWLSFQISGVGPMMGQANVFYRYAPEKLDYAIGRYHRETRRLFEVVDGQLAKTEYLAGGYSIADIANWCWIRTYDWSGVSIDGLDHLRRWLDAIAARPAVVAGRNVPPRRKTADATKDLESTGRKLLV